MATRTFSVRVAKPAEYATVIFELDDDTATPDDVWLEAHDYVDHLDATGQVEWELPDWVIEVVDIEEITEDELV